MTHATMAQKNQKFREPMSLAKAHYGEEPIWDESIKDAEFHVHQCLNWYNYCSTPKDEKRWCLDWAKSNLTKTEAAALSDLGPNLFNGVGRYARMASRGCPLDLGVPGRISPLLEKGLRTKKTNPVANKPTVQDHIQTNLDEFLGELLGVADDAVISARKGVAPSFKFADWVTKKGIAAVYLSKIASEFVGELSEWRAALDKTDPQLVEAYSYMPTKGKKLMVGFYQDIISSCKTAKPARRVYRKRKARDPSKVVAKVKFLKEHSELGIKSLNPIKILDTKMVVVYNTKYDTIEVYEAAASMNLSVKGSKIINFDPEKTFKQRVRKPGPLLKALDNAGIRACRNALKTLTTKPGIPSGLVGENSVILLAYA